jgi:hypothetical protein
MDNFNLCSGYGKWYTTNPEARVVQSEYKTITIEKIFEMASTPTSLAKDKAQWVIPSTLLTRVHAEQREKGVYYAIWGDIDEHTELESVKEVLAELVGHNQYLIYSSSRSKVELKKWRIFIPLAQTANGDEYKSLAEILNERLARAGITPDEKNTEYGQVFYLPNISTESTFYDHFISDAVSLFDWREMLKDELAQKRQQAQDQIKQDELAREQYRVKAIERVASGELLPINAYKACYDLETMMRTYGYIKCGNRWLSPNSSSGSAGVTVKNGKWISSHASDAGIGRNTNGTQWGDVFDLFVYYECNGDDKAAKIAAGSMFTTAEGISITQTNQRNHKAKEDREITMKGFDVVTELAELGVITPQSMAKDDEWKAFLKGEVLKLNKDYALVLNGSKTLVMKTTYDRNGRKERVYLSTKSFDDLFSNRHIKTGVTARNIDIFSELGVAWRKHYARADYIDGIVFEPSEYKNGKEIKPMISDKKLNLWEGFSVEPKQGDLCERLYSHIQNVICCGDHECYDYLLNWIARGFQYPAENGQVAVALKGEKGSGKGTLGKLIKSIYGQHGVQITNPKYLIGNFNAHLQDCCFLFADEAFFAGDKQHENILKSLITEDTMQIERKGIDVETVKNRLKLLMASNNDWIAPATKDERRYFVLDVSSKRIGDIQYFSELHKDINSDEVKAAFLFDMLARDLSKFHVNRVPETAGLRSQRLQTLDSFGKYWVDVLHRGYLFEKVSADSFGHDFNEWIEDPSVDLINAGYQQWASQHKLSKFDILSQTEVGKRLTKWYGAKRRGSVKKIARSDYQGGAVMTSNRPNYYLLGNLEDAKKAFCEFEKIDLTIV